MYIDKKQEMQILKTSKPFLGVRNMNSIAHIEPRAFIMKPAQLHKIITATFWKIEQNGIQLYILRIVQLCKNVSVLLKNGTKWSKVIQKRTILLKNVTKKSTIVHK